MDHTLGYIYKHIFKFILDLKKNKKFMEILREFDPGSG